MSLHFQARQRLTSAGVQQTPAKVSRTESKLCLLLGGMEERDFQARVDGHRQQPLQPLPVKTPASATEQEAGFRRVNCCIRRSCLRRRWNPVRYPVLVESFPASCFESDVPQMRSMNLTIQEDRATHQRSALWVGSVAMALEADKRPYRRRHQERPRIESGLLPHHQAHQSTR